MSLIVQVFLVKYINIFVFYIQKRPMLKSDSLNALRPQLKEACYCVSNM